ncbi:MAG TPA: carboxylating nicotinate-nucleotide diphosphorylase [Gemmatimonadaceae bacterium]|nr:carboxylating nicotinate-nucleotide diphosphorylase [Gemmatimonadaceae bacterium]
MTAPHLPRARTITPHQGTAVARGDRLRFPLDDAALEAVVRASLDEDHAFEDLTTLATVRSERRAHAGIVARQPGTIAGIPLAVTAFRLLDPHVTIRVDADDGTAVSAGTQVLRIAGSARAILSAERVALNWLQRLSGIATLTARYVAAIRGTGAVIVDTRKTTPGWRQLEKYAVRAGGGGNHRAHLASAILIKDNHLAAVDGDVALAVQRSRAFAPRGVRVEVECDTAEQADAALSARADAILLDNMSVDDLRACVERIAGRALVEASGGVTLETVRAIAETGVDWISVGALTHSARALDLSLEFETPL